MELKFPNFSLHKSNFMRENCYLAPSGIPLLHPLDDYMIIDLVCQEDYPQKIEKHGSWSGFGGTSSSVKKLPLKMSKCAVRLGHAENRISFFDCFA